MGLQIGIDVGGTFTDFVVAAEGNIFAGKVSTTPRDEATGILNAVAAIAANRGLSVHNVLADTEVIVLGTTVVTNTMLEYSGANTGMLTTKGFRDVIELRAGYKESHFDIKLPAPYPIVPRQKRLGVAERINYLGEVVIALDEAEVREAVRKLKGLKVESIAVCLLFSFKNAAHELRIREIIAEEYPEAVISLSCEVLPQVRELERFSTTMINAYVSPKVRGYLRTLEQRLHDGGFRGQLFIMLSNGGMMDVEFCSERGVELIQSGPSGGVVAAIHIGELSGYKNVIAVDMGGTSYDVCLIREGRPEIGVDSWVSRYRVAIPMIDIHSIGAGGGSIAWIDEGGALRVGPRSAGANPGPACYGRGGVEPTVTDANLVLGFINPQFFVGGKMALDTEAARAAIRTRLAEPLGMSVEEAAVGVFRIVNSAMTNAIRYVSVARGRDPRDFALMSFGGAGPIHTGIQARELGIKTILVPKNAGVFCALGGLISNFRVSKVQSFISRSTELDLEKLNELFAAIERDTEQLIGTRAHIAELITQRAMDMRYVGQTHEVTVPIRSRTRRVTELNIATTIQDFHNLHEQLYSFKRPDQPVEILSLRSDLIGVRDSVKFRSHAFESEDPSAAFKEMRTVGFGEDGFIEAKVYDGSRVRPGNLISGPAIIEEPATTIVIYPGQEAMLDHYETYVIEVLSPGA
ncbi:MAG TPA: hydantoinase/oxoprolinase family protein [Candidatus Binataceae bacterium]|nr:hydantoinase/oxoprolinase family protein [Candidatus Binataceae bacterium]